MSFRETVDLSEFADLVVVYLGMRANSWRGLGTVLAFGPRIRKAVDAKPDGLLLHVARRWGCSGLRRESLRTVRCRQPECAPGPPGRLGDRSIPANRLFW